jgi:hypothetical protein
MMVGGCVWVATARVVVMSIIALRDERTRGSGLHPGLAWQALTEPTEVRPASGIPDSEAPPQDEAPQQRRQEKEQEDRCHDERIHGASTVDDTQPAVTVHFDRTAMGPRSHVPSRGGGGTSCS